MVKETNGQEEPAMAPPKSALTEQSPPGLDLNDLALALNLINLGITRGTYDRTELRNVLDVTDKLEAFLKFQAKLQVAQQKGEV